MKILFYDTKSYDKESFQDTLKDYQGITIEYTKSDLDPRTAALAEGFDAVCAFVSSDVGTQTMDILHEKGIPAGFAEFLISDGMEKTKENIDAFKKEFDLAVQAQVEQRLKGTTPKAGSGTGGAGGMSAEIDKYL